MMEKIKIITDSACDIPEEYEKCHPDLKILSIPLTVEGEGYYERKDFTCWEFYELLEKCKTIPSTSHITHLEFLENYREAAEQGYDTVLVITINSKGSNMFEAANMAVEMFREEYPQYQEMNLYVVDSRSYTAGYGYAIEHVFEMIGQGATSREILPWLEEYFARLEIYFAVFTLDFAKKSGRISAAAGFVGEVLGLRPIISIIDGETKIVEKVRGDKNVPQKLADWYQKRSTQPDFPYTTILGSSKEYVEPFHQAMVQRVGYAPRASYQAGAAIAINAGPRLLAFIVLGKDRRKK